jgi:small-conductance mechanosensitive channel
VPTIETLPVLAVSVLVAVLVVEVVRRLLTGRYVKRWPAVQRTARRCAVPGYAVAAVAGARVVLSGHLLDLALIGTLTWLIIRVAFGMTDSALDRLTTIEGSRNVRARRIRTQVLLLRRTGAAIMVIIALAAALFTFPVVRAVGAGLLASAGVAGIVAGVAAQSTLSNVFAGLQLAFSGALRIDDVVVMDGEWGRIEELALTYVVLCLWDERRLVLPVSHFTQNSFENWTRHSSRVIGSVVLNVDWSVPVEELRTELYRLLREHPLWDQKDWILQVIDVLPNGLVQVRAMMSAHDSASAYDLRCDIRERLIEFVRVNHPSALPRYRVETPEHVVTLAGQVAFEDSGQTGDGSGREDLADRRRRP